MKAIFISDAHLKRATDERYAQLMNFLGDIKDGKVRFMVDSDELGKDAAPVDDIFFVGALFVFCFFQKEKIYPEFKLIINKLIELQKAGISIHLCEGNHDFFMKEYFHDVLGMEVFEEQAEIKLDNLQALIAHGDMVDKTNIKYVLFRKILRSRPFYHFQRFIPSSIRWALASISSNASKEMTIEDGGVLVEKMLSFAQDRFKEDYDAIVLGHCHKPVLRYYVVEGKKKTFVLR